MNFKTIISVHGVPRSGTSWLGTIIDSSPNVRYKFQPLFSYAFKNKISCDSSKNEIINYYKELYEFEDGFLDQLENKNRGLYPNFENKNDNPQFLLTKMARYHYLVPHLLKSLDNIKMIFIVRNPCAVLNSWKKAPKEYKKEWEFSKEWRFAQSKNMFRPEEYYGFHKWKEATKLFLEMKNKYSDQVLLIKYENLFQNTVDTTKRLFDFLNLTFIDQTKNYLHESSSKHINDAYSVYKGKKKLNSWENELNPNIINIIYEELENTEFEFLIRS